MHPAYKIMLLAWAAVAAWVVLVIFMNRKTHPKALFSLFMVELWERFSYYGMRAILVLYMTSELIKGGFGFDDAKAYGIYAAYGALVYLTPLIGGILADKILGFRKAISIGAALMALGQFTLFLDNETTFFMGLALLVIGNGFFKPNISSMVGKLYPDGDSRRDGAFTIFYMGINIGAFLTPLTCGAIGEIEGWHWGFFTAGVGMTVGFIIFKITQMKGWYEDKGMEPKKEDQLSLFGISPKILPYLIIAIMIPLAWVLITNDKVMSLILGVIGGGTILYLLYSSKQYERSQQQRIWVIVILLLFTTIFWTFFELAGSALNLFTERNVNKNIFGAELTTTFFQSVNPLFIVIFAPLFSWLWIKLGKSGKEPAAPYKFAVGLVLLGTGFLALNMGSATAVAGLVPAFFLIMLYLLHTLGELTLSPVGLSLVTKLAPPKIVAFLMGIWFLSSSIAHQAGAPIAKLTSVDEKQIITSESFDQKFEDEVVKKVMSETMFTDLLKTFTLEKALIQDEFVNELNKQAGADMYFVANIQLSERMEKAEALTNEIAKADALKASFTSFLTKNPDFSDKADVKVLSADEAHQLYESAVTGEIIKYVKEDSLKLGLKVFSNLGFVAIGCGILLFLLGPMIARWMHGIK